MSVFDDAISRGWQVVYALEIEGIPHTFCESIPTRYDSYDLIAEKTGGAITFTNVEALVILDGTSISQEIDRTSGISGGRAVDFYLNYDAMGSELANLFRKPYFTPEITADLDYNDTAATVDDTTGWSASGSFYIGKEYVRYGAKTSSSFTGLTRGEINEKHNFRSTSFSSYRFITDAPMIWRGRKVTLFEHLMTPDGYVLSPTWCDTAQSSVREIWKGYIDAVPMTDPIGIRLRCLPYQRQLGKKIGYSTTFDVAIHKTDTLGLEAAPWLYAIVGMSYGDELNILCEHAGGGSVALTSYSVDCFAALPGGSTSPTLTTRNQAELYVWEALTDPAAGAFLTLPFVGDLVLDQMNKDGLTLGFTKVAGYEVAALSIAVPYKFDLFEPGVWPAEEWYKSGSLYGYKVFIPWRAHNTAGSPIILHNMEGAGWQDTELATSGIAIIEADNKQEVVEYLKKPGTTTIGLPYSSDDLTVVVLTERGIGKSNVINLYDTLEATFNIGAGTAGDLKTVLLRLMESSGTGLRGDYDVLPMGFGYGIDSGDIDETAFTEPTLASSDEEATCVAEGSNSLDEIVGGWLAVQGRSVVTKLDTYTYGSSNVQKIGVVDWHVTKDDQAQVITAADVIMGQTLAPRMLNGPNSVELETALLAGKSPSVVVRDIPRIQSEGARTQSMAVPSVHTSMAGVYGASYIYHSDGLSTIELRLGPHVTVDVGDNVVLSLEHPAMYDWVSGTNKPSGGVYAKAVQVTQNLTDRTRAVTFLLSGNVDETLYLCPSALITARNSHTEIELTAGHGAHFIKSTKVMIYNRGGEADGESAEYTIAGSYVDGSDTVPVTSSLAGFVGAGSIMTHPTYGNTEAEHNQNFAFVKYDRKWTG